MADQLNTASRRSILGGAAVVAVMGAMPAMAFGGGPRGEWYTLKARFDAATAARDAYDKVTWKPAWDAEIANCERHGLKWGAWNYNALSQKVPGNGSWLTTKIDDHMEKLGDAAWQMQSDLELAPAPDRQALLWKLESLFGDPDGIPPQNFRDIMLEDARRLLGDA